MTKERKVKLIAEIAELAHELGWSLALEASDDPEDDVNGMIIGHLDLIKGIVSATGREYDIFVKDSDAADKTYH